MAEVGAEELPERAHGDGRRRQPRRLGPGDGKRSAQTTSVSYRSYWVQGRFKEDWAHWRMDGEVSSPVAAWVARQTVMATRGGAGTRFK
jgi:hypothetical protein